MHCVATTLQLQCQPTRTSVIRDPLAIGVARKGTGDALRTTLQLQCQPTRTSVIRDPLAIGVARKGTGDALRSYNSPAAVSTYKDLCNQGPSGHRGG